MSEISVRMPRASWEAVLEAMRWPLPGLLPPLEGASRASTIAEREKLEHSERCFAAHGQICDALNLGQVRTDWPTK